MATSHECNDICFFLLRFHLSILILCRRFIWQVWRSFVSPLTCIRWMLTCPQRLVELLSGCLARGIIQNNLSERSNTRRSRGKGWRDEGRVALKSRFLNRARCTNPIFCQNGPLTDPQLKSLENCHPARTGTAV